MVCLTPQMILDGSVQVPSTKEDSADLSFKPVGSLQEREAVIQSFWERWTKEYLPLLQPRTKWFTKREPLKVGDLLYLCESDHRKGWKRGIIEEVWRDGESGQVRQVIVRSSDGKKYHRGAIKVALIRT